jgi:protein required for attachment to host cells
MSRLWIVLGNASIARIFSRAAPAEPLVPLPTLEPAESRLKGHELAGDRPGHEASDHSAGGNRFEPRIDPRRKEHGRFAAVVAERLQAGLDEGAFDALWLLASDPFLGELKSHLGDAVLRRVQRTESVDLSSFGLSEIERRLAQLPPTKASPP